MLKKLLVLLVLLMCVGCGKSDKSVSQMIDDNLSLNNKNITGYYTLKDDPHHANEGVVMINSESFTDYSKADSRLVDEETFLKLGEIQKEWITPIYEAAFNELINAKYSKIDNIIGNDGLVVYFKNLDNDFILYVYEDNRIKINDGNASVSYQSDKDLTKTYETFKDFGKVAEEHYKAVWDEFR